MDHFLKLLAYDCGLSQTQYWQLRLLGSISFMPLLGVLYLLFFGRRKQPGPPAARPALSLWVTSEGRLVALPERPAPGIEEPRYS